jgi:hypothetical protein
VKEKLFAMWKEEEEPTFEELLTLLQDPVTKDLIILVRHIR